jgi:hypothetical protein
MPYCTNDVANRQSASLFSLQPLLLGFDDAMSVAVSIDVKPWLIGSVALGPN